MSTELFVGSGKSQPCPHWERGFYQRGALAEIYFCGIFGGAPRHIPNKFVIEFFMTGQGEGTTTTTRTRKTAMTMVMQDRLQERYRRRKRTTTLFEGVIRELDRLRRQ